MTVKELCQAWIDDTLSIEERKQFEQRLSAGDLTLIETLKELRGFSAIEPSSEALPMVPGEEEDHAEQKNADPEKPAVIYLPSEPAEKETSLKVRIAQIIIGVFAFLVLTFALYLQWELYLTQKRTVVLKKTITALEKEIDLLRTQKRQALFDSGRFKNILTSDFTELTKLPLEGYESSQWIQLWDKGTLRTIVLLQSPKFPRNHKLTLVSQNARTREWQDVGDITVFKEDSLYTEWNTRNLARSSGLRIELRSITDTLQAVQVLAQIRQ